MSAADIALELLGMTHALTSFVDILRAQCMRVLQRLQ